MTIAVPTREELREQLRNTLIALAPEVNPNNDTLAGVRIEMLVEALFGIHYQLGVIQSDLFVSAESSTDAIEKHAEARFGENARKGAIAAKGTAAIKVYGTTGSSVSVGDELVYSDGTRYALTSGGGVNESGETFNIESIDKGTIANREIGETLTFSSPPAGVTAIADVVVAISGGLDQETDGELVARILDAYQNPPSGGRFSDFRQWATEVEGVTTAYTYGPSSSVPNGRRGLGTVDVSILGPGSGSDRVPTNSVKLDVEENIEANRPCTVKDFTVILPTPVNQSVIIFVNFQPGYEYDWTLVGGGTFNTVASFTAPNHITCNYTTATWAADMVAGDRFYLNDEVLIVESVSGFDIYTTTEPQTTPSGSDNIWPAGPSTEAVYDAIVDYFDTLGPARGTAADPNQYWNDTLRVNGIVDAVMDVPGVLDVNLTTPSSNVVPSDTGSALQLIVSSTIDIRGPY